mmetsp:Transcript_34295/g.85453  ORF Transcript_34295/g.85453 Transcript_34295/m.85453 type:complete len:231 (+) Transcript_34295:399-1091(+)
MRRPRKGRRALADRKPLRRGKIRRHALRRGGCDQGCCRGVHLLPRGLPVDARRWQGGGYGRVRARQRGRRRQAPLHECLRALHRHVLQGAAPRRIRVGRLRLLQRDRGVRALGGDGVGHPRGRVGEDRRQNRGAPVQAADPAHRNRDPGSGGHVRRYRRWQVGDLRRRGQPAHAHQGNDCRHQRRRRRLCRRLPLTARARQGHGRVRARRSLRRGHYHPARRVHCPRHPG